MRLPEVERFFKKNKRRRGLLICFLFAFLWLLVITVTLAPCISCSEDSRIDANPSNGDEKKSQASRHFVPRPKNSRNVNGLSNFRLAREVSSTRHQRHLNKVSSGSSSVKLKIDGTQGYHLRIRRHAAYKLSERHRRDAGSGEPEPEPQPWRTTTIKLSALDGSTTRNTNVATQKSVRPTRPIKNESVQMFSTPTKSPTTDSSYTTENDTGTSTDMNDSPTGNTTTAITTTKPTTTPTTPTTTTRDPCADVLNVAPSSVFFPSAHLKSYQMRVRLSMKDATIPVQYNLSVYHDGNMVNNQVAEGKVFNITNLVPCRNYTACVVALFKGCPESARICSANTTATDVNRVQIQVFDPETSSSEATIHFNRSETDCTLTYNITVNGTTWRFNGDDVTKISPSAVNDNPDIDCKMIPTEFDRNMSAECKLTGLSPYTHYNVEVQAGSASSVTVKASKKFQTKPSSPTPIKNGSATCSENYAKISWEKPDNFNGVFEYYKLDVSICFPNGSNCQPSDQDSKKLKENHYNISNVRRGYKYKFMIRAKTWNVRGLGKELERYCYTPALPIEPQGEVLLIIAWVSTFLLMLVLLGFLLVALQKKKIIKLPYVYKWFQSGRSSKDPPGTAIPFRVTSKPVRLVDFEEHYRTMTADSSFKFSQEFEEIISGSPSCPTTVAQLNENKPKNRWINILPFDHSRVKLLPIADDVFTDFINASYIPGYRSQREFIASQGPLPNTKDDFWRMVWEQNSPMIVMVTQCIERGKEKCEQYWPGDRETHYYGDLAVKLTSESILTGYSLRIFNLHLKLPMTTSPTEIDLSDLLELIPRSSEIEKGSRTMEVKQMHFTMWPDFGCPENTSLLINFVRSVRDHMPHQSSGPIIVHCSAGVGRTGTFIAVDKLMQHIEDHDFVDIFGTVRDMRNYRTNMVQTEDQYTYIHECVKDLLMEKQTRMPVNGESGLYSNIAAQSEKSQTT